MISCFALTKGLIQISPDATGKSFQPLSAQGSQILQFTAHRHKCCLFGPELPSWEAPEKIWLPGLENSPELSLLPMFLMDMGCKQDELVHPQEEHENEVPAFS